MKASCAAPPTNKGSFRPGSRLHLREDLTPALRQGVIPGGLPGRRGMGGEGEQLTQGGREGAVARWCRRHGPGGWNVLLDGRKERFFETLQGVPKSIGSG